MNILVRCVGSEAQRSNIWLPYSIMCIRWNFPFHFQTTPTPEKPPLQLGISGLQLKGPLVSGGRWGSGGGGSWEEVNSPRGYRPMSCFICKAQCWLSLLTASHVHEVDRTTAGSCAFFFFFSGCEGNISVLFFYGCFGKMWPSPNDCLGPRFCPDGS